MRPRYGIAHIRYLWKCHKLRDFDDWHLLKCLIRGWWPLPDRTFKSSPLFEEIEK